MSEYKEPTPHQKSLARTLRAAADALDAGEVAMTIVQVYYGQIDVVNNTETGNFRVTRRDVKPVKRVGTGSRLISIALQFNRDVSTDRITEIIGKEAIA